MKKINTHTIISSLFILLFLSFTPTLVPIPTVLPAGFNDAIDNLYNNSAEIKDLVGLNNKSKSEYKAKALVELKVHYIKYLLFVSWGLVGGILFFLKIRIGRYLVLALSFLMIGKWLYQNLLTENPGEHLHAKFTMFFRAYPMEVIHYDIAANIVYLAAILFLLLPSTGKEFNITQGHKISAT